MNQPAKVITNLTGQVADGGHFEPHGTLQHVAYFPCPGVICQMKLGSAGLQYQRGNDLAVIPVAELITLFETANPNFAAAPNAPGQVETNNQ